MWICKKRLDYRKNKWLLNDSKNEKSNDKECNSKTQD